MSLTTIYSIACSTSLIACLYGSTTESSSCVGSLQSSSVTPDGRSDESNEGPAEYIQEALTFTLPLIFSASADWELVAIPQFSRSTEAVPLMSNVLAVSVLSKLQRQHWSGSLFPPTTALAVSVRSFFEKIDAKNGEAE